MNNPLYQQYNSRPQSGGNDFISRFNQFRQTFNGNPQQMIQQMMNNGRISQEQYNRAVQMANQMMKYMK